MADRLAPGFLVASPALRDPNFSRSVVVLVEYSPEGSLGFVINEPAPVTFDQVTNLLGLPSGEDPLDRTPVFTGGPVAPQSGWILFDPTDVAPEILADAVTVSDRLAVSASRRLLDAMAAREGPLRRLLALGYASWGAGQLDSEFSQGIWIPVELGDRLVFDTPVEDRWSAALGVAGIDPARMTPRRFNA